MTTSIKEWMTIGEIAALRLSGMPSSYAGVRNYIVRRGFTNDPEKARTRPGTVGLEYHKSVLLPAFDDHLNWLTAQEIIEMKIDGLPIHVGGLQKWLRQQGVERDELLFRRYGQGRSSLYHRSVIDNIAAENSKWLKSAQVAALGIPGFPRRTGEITEFMRRRGVFGDAKLCRKSRFGAGYEWHVNALPPSAAPLLKTLKPRGKKATKLRVRLERRPLARLVETFPDATMICLDLNRARDKRLIVRVRAEQRAF